MKNKKLELLTSLIKNKYPEVKILDIETVGPNPLVQYGSYPRTRQILKLDVSGINEPGEEWAVGFEEYLVSLRKYLNLRFTWEYEII